MTVGRSRRYEHPGPVIFRNCTLVAWNRRVHHFAVGLALMAIGVVLVLDDRKDFMDWVVR